MNDRGYGSVLALALLLGGVLLIGVAIDVARVVVAWREASFVAHTSAETGAGWVTPGRLYAGALVVDEPVAREMAGRYARSVGVTDVAVDSGPFSVCVTVRNHVEPGITQLIGATPRSVLATACAEPRQG